MFYYWFDFFVGVYVVGYQKEFYFWCNNWFLVFGFEQFDDMFQNVVGCKFDWFVFVVKGIVDYLQCLVICLRCGVGCCYIWFECYVVFDKFFFVSGFVLFICDCLIKDVVGQVEIVLMGKFVGWNGFVVGNVGYIGNDVFNFV